MKKKLTHKEGDLTLVEPIEITDETFLQVIQKNPLVVIDFWAPWCAPCRLIAPILKDLAKDYKEKILFCKLNVDENEKVSNQHQIMGIPTLLIFKNGILVDRIVGVQPKQILEPKIIKHIS